MKIAVFVGSQLPFSFSTLINKFPNDEIYIIGSEKIRPFIPTKMQWVKAEKQFLSQKFTVQSSLSAIGIEKLVVFNTLFPKLQQSDSQIEKVAFIDEIGFINHPYLYSFFEKKKWKRIMLNQIQFADHVKVPTDFVKFILQNQFKIDDKIKVEWTNSDVIKNSNCNNSINLPERYIIHEGTLTKRDNIFNLIQSIETLEVTLVFIGKQNSYLKKVLRYAKKRKISQRIILLDSLNEEELIDVYQNCEFIVAPSLIDYSGYGLQKAFQFRKPIILSNNLGFHDISTEFPMFVDSSNVNDLTAKISFLWVNDSERNRRIEGI